ncbi:pentatricopeptide repeat-containing protein At5g66520-like [Aristolochia californica]|uniref:pentatricopeptide repeat-containing protein At5g66520-like n=1 Tax=Aristolochia californica TaxID=171875 RepID=UPI0035D95CAD
MSVFPSPLSTNSLSSIRSPTRRAPSPSPAAIFLLQICQTLRELKQIHAQLVVTGLLRFRPAALKLLESGVSISEVGYAWSIFEQITSPDTFGFNTMIRGLMLDNSTYHSILLYKEMLLIDCIPDNHTYTFVLKACSSIKALNEEKIFDEFPQENTIIKNSMISGYFRCGCAEDARGVFYQTPVKDVATWSAMVSGYVKNEMYTEALDVFREMTVSGIKVNESVVVSALSACGRLGALDHGRWIHAYVKKKAMEEMSVILSTAIVDMYAKCGSIETSYEIFDKMRRKDVVTWSAMILGFAIHGRAEKSFDLFNEMTAAGVRPNGAVFVAVLTACHHAGSVERARYYFEQMSTKYGIKPSIEHCGCMVGVLSRAGQLAEAEEFISAMTERPNAVIWATFLSACRIHKDIRRGKIAFRHLLELEPMSGDRFKLMGQVFATTGNQVEAMKVWKLIKEGDMETTCGSSLIEVDGMVREFVAGRVGHDKAREIYMVIEGFSQTMEREDCLYC